MTYTAFDYFALDVRLGSRDILLYSVKVDKLNCTIWYSNADNGDQLAPVARPSYLVNIHTLGRYPQLLLCCFSSVRMPPKNLALSALRRFETHAEVKPAF